MKKRSDFEGIELDWVAVDSDGFVALISSAGSGPVPDDVFERYEGQSQVVDVLEKLAGLTGSMDWLLHVDRLSAAGVFAYDCKDCSPPYRRLATPSEPKTIEDFGFGQNLRDSFVALPVRFMDCAELHPELLLKCDG
jgi:hypothetical protein